MSARSWRAVVLPGLGALAAGFLTAVVSFAPFHIAKPLIDSCAPDGHADAFSLAIHERVQLSLRLLASLWVLLGIGLLVDRARLTQRATRYCTTLRRSLRSSWRSGKTAWLQFSSVDPVTHRIAVISLVLAGCLFRLWPLMATPMRNDESFTYLEYASRPWLALVSTYNLPNNHVFHSVLVKICVSLFGDSPAAVRLPAFVAGCLIVPATYCTARVLFGRGPALFSTILVAFSPSLIAYSANARGYTLSTLFFLISLSLAAGLARVRNLAGWALLGLFTTMDLLTLPTAIFSSGVIFCWLLLLLLSRQPLAYGFKDLASCLSLVGCLTFVLYLPIIVTANLEGVADSGVMTPVGPRDIGWGVGALISSWGPVALYPSRSAQAVFVAGLVGTLLWQRRFNTLPVHPLLAALLWPLAFMAATGMIPPSRAFLFGIPLTYVLAVPALHALLRWCTAMAHAAFEVVEGVAAILLSIGLVLVQVHTAPPDPVLFAGAKNAADFLNPQLRKGDCVLIHELLRSPLEYYFARNKIPRGFICDEPRATGRQFAVFFHRHSHAGAPAAIELPLRRTQVERASRGDLLLCASTDPTSDAALRLREGSLRRMRSQFPELDVRAEAQAFCPYGGHAQPDEVEDFLRIWLGYARFLTRLPSDELAAAVLLQDYGSVGLYELANRRAARPPSS